MKTFVFRAGGSLKAALCCAVALALVGFTAAFACDSLFLPPKQAFCASNGRSLPIYSVQTSEKKAAIGINCAWDDRDILPMLSTLQQNGVHATFFLLGEWAQKYPDAARTIARAGQEIGSHSNSHRDMDTLSQEEILQEIHLSCQNIHAACGQTPVLFRPPSGATTIWSSTASIAAAASPSSGIWTRWTGRVCPRRRLSSGCAVNLLPAPFCCCTQALNTLLRHSL